MSETPKDIESYGSNYSEKGLTEKMTNFAKKAGIKVVYNVLLLKYALDSPTTSAKDKAMIIGALGYFILPLDLIPDLIPVAGYSDDLAALLWAVVKTIANITPEMKTKAKEKLKSWFPSFTESEIL